MSNNPVGASTPTQPKEKSDKNFLVTILLSLFLGPLGIHRFYVGRTTSGLIMLFTIGGIFLWAIIDFIVVATGNFTDQHGRAIKP